MTFFHLGITTLFNPHGLLPRNRARAVPTAPGHWVQLAIARADDDQLLGDCALLRCCFVELSMHRMLALADTRNLPCGALPESVGLRREGNIRYNGWYKGEWCDEYQYALLASEWEVAR